MLRFRALDVYGFIIIPEIGIVNSESRDSGLFVSCHNRLHLYKELCKTQMVVMQMDIMERIFDLAARKYPEQKAFAEALGVSPTRISEWKKRKSESYMKRLPEIASVLGTTPEYLLTGQGTAPAPDPELSEMMSKFGHLTPEQKAKVIGYMEGLIAQRK